MCKFKLRYGNNKTIEELIAFIRFEEHTRAKQYLPKADAILSLISYGISIRKCTLGSICQSANALNEAPKFFF